MPLAASGFRRDPLDSVGFRWLPLAANSGYFFIKMTYLGRMTYELPFEIKMVTFSSVRLVGSCEVFRMPNIGTYRLTLQRRLVQDSDYSVRQQLTITMT